ncbi:MAG: ATP-binding protein [Holophagales bacterium]|nr:ATP-binding protein [Holophagales bacterium]
MKLFWKILAVYFLAWALLTAAVFATLLLDLRAQFIPRSPISQNLPAAVGVQIAASHLRLGDEKAFEQLAEIWVRGDPPYAVDARGRELLGRDVDPATLELARSLATPTSQRGAVRRLDAATGQQYVIFYPEGTGPEDRSPLRWFFQWPWLLAVFFAAAGLLLAGGLSAAWTRPIAALEKSFDRFAEGDLELEISPRVRDRKDEIGELALHFENMARKLASSIAAQRRLLHDISHELRSPLARLTVAAELARRRPGETGAALERIERECARLDRLIREVLTLARLENEAAEHRGAGEGDEYFDLLELLRVIHGDVELEADAVGVRVELRIPDRDELVLRGRAELLHRAIENVARNALQHAVGAERIELRLEGPEVGSPGAADPGSNGERRIRIRVHDDGQAVPAENLDSLFEAFAHGEGSEGFGLGLAIAERAVTLHGGTIRALPHPGGGVEVVIDLPYRGEPAER